MKKSIFDICEELDNLITEIEDIAEENEGVVPDDYFDRLDELELEKTDKIENISRVIRITKNDIELCKAEKKRIEKRKKMYEDRVERLSSYLDFVLPKGEAFKTDLVSIPKKTYESFKLIVKEAELPEDLLIEKKTVKKVLDPNKKDEAVHRGYAKVINKRSVRF